jgi:aminoglycoside phosphotransferase (APT) family kinase protein
MEFVPGVPDQSGCGDCWVRQQFDCFCDAVAASWDEVTALWNLGDLHPWNVLIYQGRRAVVDWSSSQ